MTDDRRAAASEKELSVWLISRMDHGKLLASYLAREGYLARWDSFFRLSPARLRVLSFGLSRLQKRLVRFCGNRVVDEQVPLRGAHFLPEVVGCSLRRTGLASWNYWQDNLLDLLARSAPPDGVDIVHGWSNYSRTCIRWANNRGILSVLDLYFPHPRTRERQLQPEFARLGLRYTPPDAALLGIIQETITRARAILVPGEAVRRSLLENGVEPDRIEVVPYGLDTRLFRPLSRPDREDGDLMALYVGLICVEKGLRTLLEGFRAFRETGAGRRAKLRLVGKVAGNAHALLREHAGEYELLPACTQADLISRYHDSDVLVHPSHSEGSALVTYEAMACGLPVIASADSGSVLRDGVDGWLIDAGDADALADRLAWSASNRDRLMEMSRAAAVRVMGFTKEGYGRRVVAAYRKFMGEA